MPALAVLAPEPGRCIVLKTCQNQRVTNRSMYVALGVNLEGLKKLLGLWLALQNLIRYLQFDTSNTPLPAADTLCEFNSVCAGKLQRGINWKLNRLIESVVGAFWEVA